MTALLSIENASHAYGGVLRAVNQVSLDLAAGETLALVGESGSGKSTLARLALGLLAPTSGRVLFDGADLAGLSRAGRLALRRQAQLIFQDPAASLSPRLSVRALLEEPARIHGIAQAEAWQRIASLLDRLGLSRFVLEKYPHQLSGGQARRVGIARALALGPRLLVADEPFAGLDASIRGELVNLLNELQRELGLAMLKVSHDLNVVRAVSDRVAVMYLGRIVEQGSSAAVFAAPAHPYTAALLAAAPRIVPGRRALRPLLPGEPPSLHTPPPGCPFHPRCAYADAACQVPPPMLRLADGRDVACVRPLVGDA
jgi:oligopeptide transport system ATP-binding protein